MQKFQIALTPAGINNLVTAGHQTGIETLKPAQQCVNPVLDDNGLTRGLSTLKEVIGSHAAKFLGMMGRFKSLDEL